jgi:hypothetical protein
VAANWRSIDKETKDYCYTVARILKERHSELSQAEGVGNVSTMDSVSARLKEMEQGCTTDSNQKNNSESTKSGPVWRLSTMDFVSSEQANEKKRKELLTRIPGRLSDAYENQQTNQYFAMCEPASIDPVAHVQGMMIISDKCSRQQNQVFTDSSTAMVWGNEDNDSSNAEMLCPIQSWCIHQGIEGAHVRKKNGGYGDELECPIITHGSQTVFVSNTMSTIHSSKQLISPHAKLCSFGEHKRWSMPECLQTSKQEHFQEMYEAQELDIPDSDIIGMWLSNKVQDED